MHLQQGKILCALAADLDESHLLFPKPVTHPHSALLFVSPSAAKVCASVPPAANNAAAWNATQCAGRLVGGTCSAACLPTATGAGFVATCTGDNAWNVTGSCTRKHTVLPY
jgi:hypothetical protein